MVEDFTLASRWLAELDVAAGERRETLAAALADLHRTTNDEHTRKLIELEGVA